jgi:hypothetical protein
MRRLEAHNDVDCTVCSVDWQCRRRCQWGRSIYQSQWLHTGGETIQAFHIPRDARATRLSSFRLLALASLQLDACRKLLI